MARILYGIQGDAGGHVSRALSVAELLEGHEILFVGAGQAVKARGAGYAFEEMPLIGMLVRNNTVQMGPTVANFLRRWVTKEAWIRRLREIMTTFDPDLILTDNEFFTPRAACALGRPCLSLDHQHVLSRTRYATPPGQRLNRAAATALMRFFLPDLASRLIVSFHRPPLIDPERDAAFGTLPRSDALALQAEPGDHVVMYLPGCDREKILALFGKRRRECRVYGLGEQPGQGNVRFCESGREPFLIDLASAAYVVCCGGHGLLTEALVFGKPCLCFPGSGLYEQFWNCWFMRENGYGTFYPSFDQDLRIVDDFEVCLENYAARIAKQDCNGREDLRAHLNMLLRA